MLLDAGTGAGDGAATGAGLAIASGDASGFALLSAIALKPTIEREIATIEENNFFIVVKIKCVNIVFYVSCVFFILLNQVCF